MILFRKFSISIFNPHERHCQLIVFVGIKRFHIEPASSRAEERKKQSASDISTSHFIFFKEKEIETQRDMLLIVIPDMNLKKWDASL